jgi:hypothetical protein
VKHFSERLIRPRTPRRLPRRVYSCVASFLNFAARVLPFYYLKAPLCFLFSAGARVGGCKQGTEAEGEGSGKGTGAQFFFGCKESGPLVPFR